MVYTSTSLALAAMEFFVHLDPGDSPNDLVNVAAELPDRLHREHLAVESLPADWRKLDNECLRRLASQWAAANRSVALQVPSAVLVGEWNVLLNPMHRDFAKIVIGRPEPFCYDERMFKRKE